MLAAVLQAGLPWLAEKIMTVGKTKAEKYIKEKTGVDIDINDINKQPPEVFDQIKQLDASLKLEMEQNRHSEEVMKHDETMFNLSNEDTKNARELTEKTIDSEDEYVAHFSMNMSYVVVILSFVAMLTPIILGVVTKIPDNLMHLVDMLYGIIPTTLFTVLKHWFGSYQEQKQSKQLANMQEVK